MEGEHTPTIIFVCVSSNRVCLNQLKDSFKIPRFQHNIDICIYILPDQFVEISGILLMLECNRCQSTCMLLSLDNLKSDNHNDDIYAHHKNVCIYSNCHQTSEMISRRKSSNPLHCYVARRIVQIQTIYPIPMGLPTFL